MKNEKSINKINGEIKEKVAKENERKIKRINERRKEMKK